MHLRTFALAACCTLLTASGFAQAPNQGDGSTLDKPTKASRPDAKPLPSPAASAHISLNGKDITIHYNSPRLKGRTVGVEVAPYGKVWRTGANPATTLIASTNLKIGDLDVPAGTYTLFTLPSETQWLLIVSKKTGEWGIPYPEGDDLGRTPMTGKTLSASQEDMSISFEHTHGATTQLHVKWGTIDQYVTVIAE